MKKIIFFTFFLLTAAVVAYGQRVLKGVVRDPAGTPVEGVKVYTSFITTTTDKLGKYGLDLSGCNSCTPGAALNIYTFKEEYGADEKHAIISNDYTFNFSIPIKPAKIFLIGSVENYTSGAKLSGIQVRFTIAAGIEVEPVISDGDGEFKLILPKAYLDNMNAVRLRAKDPNNKYAQISNGSDLFAVGSYVTIRMRPVEGDKFDVAGYKNTDICYNQGDLVSITATGNIRVGNFVGNSDPDGRSSGVMGMSLESYNIVSEYNHAVLMYRVSPRSKWLVAGKKIQFIAQSYGCIEFQVNDLYQNDNHGTYIVEVTVEKTG